MARDKIDQAIRAASIDNSASANVSIKVTIGPGRVVGLLVPKDLALVELVALMGYMATKLPATLAAADGNLNAAARRRILVPS